MDAAHPKDRRYQRVLAALSTRVQPVLIPYSARKNLAPNEEVCGHGPARPHPHTFTP